MLLYTSDSTAARATGEAAMAATGATTSEALVAAREGGYY